MRDFRLPLAIVSDSTLVRRASPFGGTIGQQEPILRNKKGAKSRDLLYDFRLTKMRVSKFALGILASLLENRNGRCPFLL